MLIHREASGFQLGSGRSVSPHTLNYVEEAIGILMCVRVKERALHRGGLRHC